MTKKRRAYLIGHGNLSLDGFLKSLIENKIGLLVDVRSNPYSGYVSHFNRESLMEVLASKNIKYRYMGNVLGGRQTAFIKASQTKNKFSQFRSYMKSEEFKTAIEKLKSLIKSNNLAIMCSELDYKKCHRQFIREKLIKDDYDVKIIEKHGDINPQQTLGVFNE
ncbi:MAG: DUF488 domain-containing protein [Nanoarchaeota archaeon]